MATKEPVRRCVRCKTKKKGCSRGNPCERCALAGLSAEECIYLDSDATFRSVKPKKTKEPAVHVPVAQTTKIPRATSVPTTDPNAIVRCSRCIRTARGCSHERPCQPCREHGLSEWECRYTSASSFKVRGPGARDVRKMKSLERIPAVSDFQEDGILTQTDPKQIRSYSTNTVPDIRAQLVLNQIPRDYRTPSPPTNISPISEPANYRDRSVSESPSDHRSTPRQPESSAVPIPGSKQKYVVAIDRGSASVSRPDSSVEPVSSIEPPPTVHLIPSVSQQSHANTVPESSPAIYTDDYQSSPSPFNSPQFQSSPPVHFHPVDGSYRMHPTAGESSMFPPQMPYRPPAGYVMQGQARQYAAAQAQHGFVTIPSPQNSLPFQQLSVFSQSPPYSQQQQQQQYLAHNHSLSGSPRHRTIPNPAPRYASPGPYAIPARPGSYQNTLTVGDGRGQATSPGIPIRRKAPTPFGSYSSHGASPRDHVEVDHALMEFKNKLTRQTSQTTATTQEQTTREGEGGPEEREEIPDLGEWQDELGVFAEQVMND
ncbi:protein of unknown function [Taphrina deformans PYCC 5710]|uniref:Zn(2)-C6 fungal-type domain-containing protein n=1 Tax=Taphrina deformans (strain PYCC 5710 / ATCC 11124 / CBS 356.35 / IMI 108563 / JCM 9778 / NBRC 8474) TaxID=1097556 RepID=R4XHE1_TAPDE|nr:protein of unknown function [Taphrina deformans PYCC 5710]|eukprot:CCG85103.1 protein of unknown function [Taphrina deformans PYCC 5710]